MVNERSKEKMDAFEAGVPSLDALPVETELVTIQ